MKRGFIISILAISALFLASCEKEPVLQQGDGNYYPIFRGYMQFSTEVSTRAQLATNMRGKDFGVIGYQYSSTSNWGAANTTTIPMADFFNQKVSCSAQGSCTYDVDGTMTGDQYKLWEDSKYTFFAYHPYNGNGNGITLSSKTAADTPLLIYTYPWVGEDRIPIYSSAYDASMYDLMTAEDIDCDGSRNVKFDFKHRLFALEVLANNYNETQFQYVYDTTKPVWEYEKDDEGNILMDDDGNPIIKVDASGNKIQATNEDGTPKYEILLDENGHKVIATDADGNKIILKDKDGNLLDATVEISDLSVEISGLQYSSMTIPLTTQSGKANYIERNDSGDKVKGKTIQFDIQNVDLKIPAFNDPVYDDETGKVIAGDGVATSISKKGTTRKNGYLMFIPQDEPITFSLLWHEITGVQGIDRTIESTVKFEPGYLYQLIVNFIGSGITIHLIKVGAWDDQTVYHTFE